jgi:hypothetical protein
MVITSRQANKECQMTAVVIVNIVFAAFVLVGICSLLGRAISAEQRRATETRPAVSFGIPGVRPRFAA